MQQPNRKLPVDRREFLRLIVSLGGATALSAILEACSKAGLPTPTTPPTAEVAGTDTPEPATPTTAPTSPPSSTPEPTPTSTVSPTVEPTATSTSTPVVVAEHEKVPVAFVKTTDRAEGVRRAIDLLGINPVDGKEVFIKPNFNSSDPPPASTHPEVLRSLITKLREMGAQSFSMGDRSGQGWVATVMKELGIIALAEELGIELIDFDRMEASDWVMVQFPGSHWKRGFPFARPCMEAEALINVCCLKTHQFGGHFTMSLKNAVGMVARDVPHLVDALFMDELHESLYQRLMIAEINTAYTPALIVLDGVEAFRHGGPAEGTLATPEVVLAGTDRIAIDAVGVAILRYFGTTAAVSQGPIFQQEQIARAVELGLGVDSPHKIKMVTGDDESAAYAGEIRDILIRE